MKRLLSVFDSKYSSGCCLFLAIACRVVNVLFVSYAGRDKMFLVLQSKSFLEGKGLSIPQYFSTNLDTPVYDFTPLWPPGYPVLLAPFLKIFNFDVYWATTVLDILACIAFVFVVRKICRQIGFSTAAVNIMTLIAGCFEYTFINESLPTDTVSLVFLLTGFSLTLNLLADARISLIAIAVTAFFLFIPCTFRYMYPPVTIIFPLVILITGFLKKGMLLKKKGGWLFIMTSVMLVIFFILLKNLTGSAGYVTPTERGIFPENIVHWHPLVPSSFINLAFFTSQTIRLTGVPLQKTMLLLEVINVIVILSLAGVFLYHLFIKKKFSRLSSFKWFLLTGFFISAVIFASLGYLSLTYEVQRGLLNIWSYVYESRYYAFVVVFLQIAFLGWIFLYGSSFRNPLLKTIVIFCFLSLFIEITHNIYFHTKVAFNFKEYKSDVFREQDYSYFNSLMPSLEKKYPGYDILVAAPGDNFYTYTAVYLGHKGIFDAASLNNNLPAIKRPAVLILMLYDNEVPEYSKYLSGKNVRLIKKVVNSNYYLRVLNP